MISEEEYGKKVKQLIGLYIVGAILGVIGILLADAQGYESLKIGMAVVDAIIFVVLLVVSYILSKKKKIAGPILGIILGAWDILHLSVYSIIAGIYIIVHCASMCKDVSALNKSEKTEE